MQINIKQTKANFRNEFEIAFNEHTLYRARTSWVSSMLECVLSDWNNNVIMKTAYDTEVNLKNAIPFKWIFRSPQISISCTVIAADGTKGTFALETVGFSKSYYTIDYKDMALKGYAVSKGNAKYIAFYDAAKDVQVGLLVKPLDVENNLDTYTLYLLDDANCDPVALSLFAVYFDNWKFSHHGELNLYKRETRREWTLSKYNKKYDPEWISKFRTFM